MASPLEYQAAVSEFAAHIPNLVAPIWFRHSTGDVRDFRVARKQPWGSAAGVYGFFNGADELRYVGRALAGIGLGRRVPDHLHESRRGNKDWDLVLDDKGAYVLVCQLADKDAVWAPSLELFLCERFPGLVNKRRS